MDVIKAVGDEFEKISGRPFDVVKTYGVEDAERVIVVVEEVVDVVLVVLVGRQEACIGIDGEEASHQEGRDEEEDEDEGVGVALELGGLEAEVGLIAPPDRQG